MQFNYKKKKIILNKQWWIKKKKRGARLYVTVEKKVLKTNGLWRYNAKYSQVEAALYETSFLYSTAKKELLRVAKGIRIDIWEVH